MAAITDIMAPRSDDTLREVVERHSGMISGIAQELGQTRAKVTTALAGTFVTHGQTVMSLSEYASRLRLSGCVRARHVEYAEGSDEWGAERARIISLLAGSKRYRAAAKAAGMSASTMARRMRQYAIQTNEVDKARKLS